MEEEEAGSGADLICDQLKVTLLPPTHTNQSMRLCLGSHEETEGETKGRAA